MKQITIRDYDDGDRARCMAIVEATLGLSHAQSFTSNMDAGWNAYYYVAISAGRVVGLIGYCWPGFGPGTFTINLFAVDPAAQGHRVGRRLFDHLTQKLTAKYGLTAMFVASAMNAVGFYARLGFEPFHLHLTDQYDTYLMRCDFGRKIAAGA